MFISLGPTEEGGEKEETGRKNREVVTNVLCVKTSSIGLLQMSEKHSSDLWLPDQNSRDMVSEEQGGRKRKKKVYF